MLLIETSYIGSSMSMFSMWSSVQCFDDLHAYFLNVALICTQLDTWNHTDHICISILCASFFVVLKHTFVAANKCTLMTFKVFNIKVT